jgi:hypothetical protein
MGFRFSKRVNTGNGWGLNFSGSGVSSSYRNDYGSFSAKGFSIRTGIPGLSFRGSWGSRKSKGNTALIMLGIMLALFLLYVAAVILYNLILLLIWCGTELYHWILRIQYRRKMKQLQNKLTILENETENNTPENL